MDRELVLDYLERSGMPEAQADALSRVLAEFVTNDSLRAEMAALKADLTWRFIAGIGFFAAIMTVVDLFVD